MEQKKIISDYLKAYKTGLDEDFKESRKNSDIKALGWLNNRISEVCVMDIDIWIKGF